MPKTPQELIDEFERDIHESDCHSLSSKVSRSHARREIQEDIGNLLCDIGMHLDQNVKHLPETSDRWLGWAVLIAGAQNIMPPELTLPPSPATNRDWFIWTCRFATIPFIPCPRVNRT